MAIFQNYRTEDGRRRVLANVRVKGFRPTARAFDSMAAAKDWAHTTEKELRALRDRGGARSDVTRLTVADLIVAHLEDPQVQQLRGYDGLQSLLATWVDEYGTVKLRAFGYLQIIAMRSTLLGRGLSAATTNRYISQMRRAWNWGNPHYVQTPWPQKVMLAEPTPEAINEYYGTSEATVEDVHAVIAASDAISEPLGNLVRFLIGTGARLSDALSVTWKDIDKDSGTVMIRGQKTQRPQKVAMLAPALDALARIGKGKIKHIKARVFWQYEHRQSMRSEWTNARKSFPEGLTNLRLHDCRHLCASFLAANGASNVELMSQLGHKSLSMVARYSHLSGGHRGAAHDKLDAAFKASAATEQ